MRSKPWQRRPFPPSPLRTSRRNPPRRSLDATSNMRDSLALSNPWVQWRQRPQCTTFAKYDAPWRNLFTVHGITRSICEAQYGGIAYSTEAAWRDEPNDETKSHTAA